MIVWKGIKEKLPMVIAVIVAIGILALAYYFMFIHQEAYYTQIDNEKIEQISTSDDMKYEYTLTAYNSNGKEKEVKFKTIRALREDGYLEVDVMKGRKVVDWREVQYQELQEKVQENY